MIESIFQLKWVVSRHQQALLLKERGTVLSALPAARNEPQGTSQHGPRADCRHPIPSDGRTPRSQLGRNKARLPKRGPRKSARIPERGATRSRPVTSFVAKKWLRFHGKLKIPSPPRARFANELDDFVAYMASEQGLSPIAIRSHRWKTSKFLEWFANRHRLLSSATLDDVDEFLAFKTRYVRELMNADYPALRRKRIGPHTIRHTPPRTFFVPESISIPSAPGSATRRLRPPMSTPK